MNLDNLRSGLRGLGTTKKEQTQKQCETVHDELASLKQIAVREDGSDETKKARKDILTLALLLDGEGGVLLDYLTKIRNDARVNPAD